MKKLICDYYTPEGTKSQVFTKTSLLFKVIGLFFICIVSIGSIRAQNQNLAGVVNFQYKGISYSKTIELPSTEFVYYKSLDRQDYGYQDYASEHPGHEYFGKIAQQIIQPANDKGYVGKDLIGYISAFVQGIEYKLDGPDNMDYPKFPIETVLETSNDCEDTAGLLCALLNTFGFNTKLIYFPGHHMAVGVECAECDGYAFTDEATRTRYVFIEPTLKTDIGVISLGLLDYDWQILHVQKPALFDRGPINYNQQYSYSMPNQTNTNTFHTLEEAPFSNEPITGMQSYSTLEEAPFHNNDTDTYTESGQGGNQNNQGGYQSYQGCANCYFYDINQSQNSNSILNPSESLPVVNQCYCPQ
ncbi:MAG: hypothetical protein M0D57_04610 [Sphingobacteriales bacterium JAD_PAG50586_3]|nr:MAG: hypothetical protein M0D57_04610 [Sphingobacteriales bacterium JAD_PAG50586_3]